MRRLQSIVTPVEPDQTPLLVLIADDDDADVELEVRTLQKSGYAITFDVASKPEALSKQLKEKEYDLILCDHNLRSWTGLDVLETLHRCGKNIPLIVVTGTLGDEAAVEYIKQGAVDYVVKDHLERLPLAVNRALLERKQHHEQIRLQEEILTEKTQWDITFQSVPDPVFLLDTEGRIQRANRAAAQTLGLGLSDMVGKVCCEVIHRNSGFPADCPHRIAMLDGREVRCDAEESWLGMTFDITSTPLFEKDGALRGCVHVMRDISERKKTEAAMRDSAEKYRLLFETNPFPMWVYNPDTLAFLAVNEAAVQHYGYTRDEFLVMTLKDIRPPEAVSDFLNDIGQVAQTHQLIRVWKHQKKDGTVIDVELAGQPMIFESKRARLVIARDVTEQRLLEEQFRQSQKMEAMGRLAGGVAHDFNNLLTVILGYSTLAAGRIDKDDTLRKYIEDICAAATRASSLTRQLLTFSRKQIVQPTLLNLNTVVGSMEKMLERLIGEDVALHVTLDPELGQIKADPSQIEQVLMNLVVNARDAMPQGGQIGIRTANADLDERYPHGMASATTGRYVLLAVSDTGLGIDAATRRRMFEPFFTTKEPGKGTGLGLATVYGIVQQSGGDIFVYSEMDRGTTFKVYFPRIASTETEAPEVVSSEMLQGSETVLLVEDDNAVFELTSQIIRDAGYTILSAHNAESALALCERHREHIDIMVTDVIMPRMSGPELAAALVESRPRMQVLYVSGYTDDAIVQHGILGAQVNFLEKPFVPEVLLRKIREVLNRKSRN